MKKKKTASFPRLHVPENASVKAIYARARAEFTAADLEKYAAEEPMVSMEQVLQRMEKVHRSESRRAKKSRKK